MGQQDIVEFLKKNRGKKFNSTQIKNNIESNNMSKPLIILRRHNTVKFEKVKENYRLRYYYWVD